jgi:hypothetical protein
VAGANIGDGPGFEVVLFCSVLATFYLLVLWFLIAWASGLADSITIECDLGAGIRAGGWFAGTGVVIGACVAGDWISAAATLRDFVRYAWPLAIFAWALDCCRLVRWSESGSPRYSRLPEGSWDCWCPHRCREWLYAGLCSNPECLLARCGPQKWTRTHIAYPITKLQIDGPVIVA